MRGGAARRQACKMGVTPNKARAVAVGARAGAKHHENRSSLFRRIAGGEAGDRARRHRAAGARGHHQRHRVRRTVHRQGRRDQPRRQPAGCSPTGSRCRCCAPATSATRRPNCSRRWPISNRACNSPLLAGGIPAGCRPTRRAAPTIASPPAGRTRSNPRSRAPSTEGAPARDAFVARMAAYVLDVDRLVYLLEHDLEQRIQALRLIQGAALFAIVVVMFISLFLMHAQVIVPLADLLACARRVRVGDFTRARPACGRGRTGPARPVVQLHGGGPVAQLRHARGAGAGKDRAAGAHQRVAGGPVQHHAHAGRESAHPGHARRR